MILIYKQADTKLVKTNFQTVVEVLIIDEKL